MKNTSRIKLLWWLVALISVLFFGFLTQGYAFDITLTWNASSDPHLAGYKIYYKKETCDPPYVFTDADQGPSPIMVPLGELADPTNPAYTVTGLKDGDNYFFVITAVNLQGEESGYSHEISNSSASAPLVNGDAATTNTTPTWNWESGGGGTGLYRYKLDDGDWVGTVSTSYNPDMDLLEGSHTLYVQERDADGLWSGATTFTTAVDLTPPSAPIVEGSSLTNDITPTWSWSSGDGGNGTFRYKLDDSDFTLGATETTATSYTTDITLTEGDHTLYLQERDEAGNWSEAGSFTTAIDITPPTAPIASGTEVTDDTTPTWSWSSGGGGNGTFRYKLDDPDLGTDAMVTADTSFAPESALPEGTYILYLQEQDDAGNWSDSGSFAIFVDIPPNPPLVSGPSVTNSNTPTWSWTSGGGGSCTYRFGLDIEDFSEAAVTNSSSYTPPGELVEGEHTLYVQERDEAGNWSDSGWFTIYVDAGAQAP